MSLILSISVYQTSIMVDDDLRITLKRKFCESDFESVESLKGLDINDNGEIQRPPLRHERKRCDSEKGSETAHRNISETSNPRIRSISLSQGPAPELFNERKKLPVVFKWDQAGAKHVSISGSFDNWKSKIPLAKSGPEEWYTIIDLPLGSHQYKFHVDGQWLCNPNEPKLDNGMGSENNTATVKNSDFEVFEALATDSVSTGHSKSGISGSPPGDYGQMIPPRTTGFGFHSGPPILPPHLLQVILNKEIPTHCEPTLLPEPNHVMLNHLYALSIKDGVMVLSSTHRYRKKYVTTLLYKPI